MPSRLIEIPPDDIFKNDRLGLEPAIQVQSEALLSRAPQAIAIDAPWGSGKTTFMALWEAYLIREGVKVVTFNAWKFSLSDPLDALTREILRQFEEIPAEQRQPAHRRLLKFVQQNTKHIRRGLKMGSLFSPELAEATDIVDPFVSSAEAMVDSAIAATSSDEKSTELEAGISSPGAFTSALSSAAMHWSNKPVVVMVDELDRCSPEYAVEMLQLLEHVFCADNVVFVVSMNRAELVHSVKAFYGQSFNADGYLERFFDNVFPLPTSNRLRYITSALTSIKADERGPITPRVLPFLYSSDLSLREINRALEQLDESLDSYAPTYEGVGLGLVYLWLVRTLVPVEYREFISSEISDKGLADAVFANGTCGELLTEHYETNGGYAIELQAVLIMASYFRDHDPFSEANSELSARSELYYHHQSASKATEGTRQSHLSYSHRVTNYASELHHNLRFGRDSLDIVKVTRLLDRDALPT